MEEVQTKTSVEKPARFQFSLRTMLVVTLLFGAWMGLVKHFPETVLSLTFLTVLVGSPIVCFVYKKHAWGVALILLFVFISVLLMIPPFSLGLMRKRRMNPDRQLLGGLQAALMRYNMDHNAYPPINAGTTHSSSALFTALQVGQPSEYINLAQNKHYMRIGVEDVLITTAGDPILYQPFVDSAGVSQYVLVTPGKDRLLGGTMSAQSGFVPDLSDANGDGTLDHVDNLVVKN